MERCRSFCVASMLNLWSWAQRPNDLSNRVETEQRAELRVSSCLPRVEFKITVLPCLVAYSLLSFASYEGSGISQTGARAQADQPQTNRRAESAITL